MPKKLWFLIIGMVINTTGSSFLWPLNTIYIHNMLGHSLSFAGLILMLNSGAGIVGNLFGGILFDKVGGYRSVLIGLGITTAAGLLLTIFHSTLPYAILLTIVGFGSGIIFPAMFAMAGMVWPDGGRKPFNAIYVSQNVGVAIGTSIGGVVASFSFNWIFSVNAFLFVCFTVFAFLTYKTIDSRNEGRHLQTNILEQSKPIKHKGPFIALIILCSGLVLCWIGYVQWQSTIASYTQELNIPLSLYSLLWTLNGLLIVLGQPLVSIVTKKVPQTKIQMVSGICLFIASFVILSFATRFPVFMLAMVILTLGEMLVWPAVPTIANRLAPKGRQGFYQGFVNSAGTCGRMIGPLFGGLIVDVFNIQLLIIVLCFLFIGAIITSIIYDKPLENHVFRKETTEM
ncbi:MFS family permease [Pullulanibacillus pueri]|uniref:Putative MFS-type transporter YttB n=1 Tax=Pullulanibacillus pueri TaxID=1437324 RepID=A0A8J3A013_9BACL|nr:MFS transporter [Pullulanibacillus pueri]MBM7683828.1 MFS family permease [Pullulanibacillus pueri]GGH87755.1 putative MFS-type transporter YttB [Pullulanibacillus pueri]